MSRQGLGLLRWQLLPREPPHILMCPKGGRVTFGMRCLESLHCLWLPNLHCLWPAASLPGVPGSGRIGSARGGGSTHPGGGQPPRGSHGLGTQPCLPSHCWRSRWVQSSGRWRAALLVTQRCPGKPTLPPVLDLFPNLLDLREGVHRDALAGTLSHSAFPFQSLNVPPSG